MLREAATRNIRRLRDRLDHRHCGTDYAPSRGQGFNVYAVPLVKAHIGGSEIYYSNYTQNQLRNCGERDTIFENT